MTHDTTLTNNQLPFVPTFAARSLSVCTQTIFSLHRPLLHSAALMPMQQARHATQGGRVDVFTVPTLWDGVAGSPWLRFLPRIGFGGYHDAHRAKPHVQRPDKQGRNHQVDDGRAEPRQVHLARQQAQCMRFSCREETMSHAWHQTSAGINNNGTGRGGHTPVNISEYSVICDKDTAAANPSGPWNFTKRTLHIQASCFAPTTTSRMRNKSARWPQTYVCNGHDSNESKRSRPSKRKTRMCTVATTTQPTRHGRVWS